MSFFRKIRLKMGKRADIFSTDHLHANLGARSAHSGVVTALAQASKLVLTMATTAVLARILEPEDFGLFAMVGSVLVFVTMFQDAGLSMATVQRAKINHDQVSTLFWANVTAGTLMAGLILAISPLLAYIFDDHRVAPIAMGLAIPTFLSGVCAQHGALLQRQMRFLAEQSIVVTSQVVGAATAIIAALMGAGYWALVLKAISASVVVVFIRWWASGWTPGLPKRGSGAGEMARFGANLTAGRFFNEMSSHADNLLLGYFGGPAVLGLYSKAYGLLALPVREVNKPIGMIAVPALSRLQNNPERFRRFYLRGLEMVAFISMPIIVFATIGADKVILLMLGEKWSGSIEIFRALAPAAFVGTISVAGSWLLIPFGKGKKLFHLSVVSSFVTVLGFVIGLQWGALGVATALSVTTVILKVPGLAYACKGSPVSLFDIGSAILRTSTASCVAGLLIILVGGFIQIENLLILTGCHGVIYAISYLLLFLVLPGGAAVAKGALDFVRPFWRV
ncbi:lipopolysaccharide biosynthesis protein [Puniceicoccaceae bacterium K14]|nr:lipopolysaccharide biosynthesis protein [Puniceicoccaceae bacterium K14]